MSIYFISDLHLNEQSQEITQKFTDFLYGLPKDTQALYILGDLFEVWIGDDENTAFQQKIACLLKTASQIFPIYFMPGNRDFLLGENYCKQSGMIYLEDPTLIEIDHVSTLLVHGDSLCTHDKLHQGYRRIVRTKLFKKIFLVLPLAFRKIIASRMRQNSQRRNQKISMELMDISFDSLKKIMSESNVSQIIYGHTHRPSIFFFTQNQQFKTVFVLSDWHEQGHALQFMDAHHHQSIYF